jgi:hypothetical protein
VEFPPPFAPDTTLLGDLAIQDLGINRSLKLSPDSSTLQTVLERLDLIRGGLRSLRTRRGFQSLLRSLGSLGGGDSKLTGSIRLRKDFLLKAVTLLDMGLIEV